MSEAQKWSSRIQFMRDNYILRILEPKFGESKSSGNPMITFDFEIVSPEEMQVGDEMFNVAGVKLTQYFPTQVIENGQLDVEKTQKAAARLQDFYKKCGVSFDGFNPENPDVSSFKGKLIWALLNPDVREQRKSPTSAQLAAGQREGDIIKNPITGEPLLSYYPKIGEVFGLAPADPNKPF